MPPSSRVTATEVGSSSLGDGSTRTGHRPEPWNETRLDERNTEETRLGKGVGGEGSDF